MKVEMRTWVDSLDTNHVEGPLRLHRARTIARQGRIPSALYEFGRWTCDSEEPDPRKPRGRSKSK
jgi:hypothetical protein